MRRRRAKLALWTNAWGKKGTKSKKINIFLEFFFTRHIPDFFPVLTVIFYSPWFTGHLL